MPYPLGRIIDDFVSGDSISAQAKFALALPAIEEIRSNPQPSTNKALLKEIGVIPAGAVRLPLESTVNVQPLRERLESHLGPLDAVARPASV
jgi:hypothetical protein